MVQGLKLSYVLPSPRLEADWDGFDGDLACLRHEGYDAVELQIANPVELDEPRLRASLAAVGFDLCAFQTGGTYATRGNCLCSPDAPVRRRTEDLLRAFVDLARRFGSVIVFGSLQGQRRFEPDLVAGRQRIVEAMTRIGRYATSQAVRIAYEPVNHLETDYFNRIADVVEWVRRLGEPGLALMVDTFHMNIEEASLTAPLAAIGDLLAHVHLSETNRDVLGRGHLPTSAFLQELRRIGYRGICSVGVYHTDLPRRDCIRQCMEYLRDLPAP